MRSRAAAVAVFITAALAVCFALVPVRGEQIHRHGFNGRQTVLVRGDAGVKVNELEHDISTGFFKSQPSSEHIKLNAEAATGDAAFIHYYYHTPPAPISELLTASIWVRATKPGIQLRARVIFPKEPDPANPLLPLTTLIVGKTYEKNTSWEKLTLEDVPEVLAKHLPVLQTRIGRAVNTTDAYIDRLVLNLYTSPGNLDVWVDDLDIGPVKTPDGTDTAQSGTPGVGVSKTRTGNVAVGMHARQVEQRGGAIFVNGKPFLFRAIRHTGTPLFVLRQAGFDTLWLPENVSPELLDEATREGWMVIPTVPISTAQKNDTVALNGEAESLAQAIRKFGSIDVLYYDLGGGGRTAEQADQLYQTCDAIRSQDPRRPRGADLWDGFGAFSPYLDVVGVHRWPLFTSLDMKKYRDWLSQRKTLTAERATFWTWIQNHLPDWYITTVLGQKPTDPFTDPIGPHPEQVRLMAFIALASGCRGLGFWSDRFLADSHQGRDRLQGMALLNAEIDMLSPAIMSIRSRPIWLPTSEPNVRAALLQSDRGAVLIPIWFGPNTQFVPDQGAVSSLKVTVPLIADGAEPWRVSPAGVECMNNQTKKVVGGTELSIPDFDFVTPIVFTNDRAGLVVWWQDYVRKYSRLAARWALDMAAVEYGKVYTTYTKLNAMGQRGRDVEQLFAQSASYHAEARQYFASELYSKAHAMALQAMRPLRIIMADYWKQATITLDTPTASPYAVSYFTLPKHWELFRELQGRRPGDNLLPGGNFEVSDRVPSNGIRVDGNLPGWRSLSHTLDNVEGKALLFRSQSQKDVSKPRETPKPIKGIYTPGREIHPPDEHWQAPIPELGNTLLKLEIRRLPEFDKEGKPVEQAPTPLERTYLAVYSPPVHLPPGTLVRVSGWIKVPGEIQGCADGVMFYDDAGGEQLSVRTIIQKEWKQFHLYRIVPASGQISVTIAMNGIGVAYFDNIVIEPMIPRDSSTPPHDTPNVQTSGAMRR